MAGIVMPVKFFTPGPAVTLFELAPVQVPPAAPPTALIFVSVSEKNALVCGVALELVSVMITCEVPFSWIVAGLNCLLMVFVLTVRFATLLPGPAPVVSLVVTPVVLFGLTP